VTSELFSSVYKEKSDHLFDDRIFSCPVPAFTHWSIFVPLSEKPYKIKVFQALVSQLVLFLTPTLFRGSSLAYLYPKYYPKQQF